MEIQQTKISIEQIAKEYIEYSGWKGTLNEIRDCLPAGDFKRKKIENAIALIPTQVPSGITMKDAIATHGLTEFLSVLVEEQVAVKPKRNQYPCPDGVLEILKELLA